MANTKIKRVSNSEVQVRIEYITGLIAQGFQRTYIQDQVQQAWDVSPVTARLYIRKAQDRIAEIMRQERPKQLAKLLLRYEYLYKESVERQDYKTAKTVLDSMGRMMKLDNVMETADVNTTDVMAHYEIEDTF